MYMRVLGTTACSIVALILSSCGGSTSSSEGMLGEIPAYYEKQGLDFCAQVSEIGKSSGYSQDQETVEKVVKLAMDLSEKSKEEGKTLADKLIGKVILETGELKTIESVFNASLIGAYAGADFIKTSTGKVPVNATPETVYVICEALRQFHAQTGKMVGIKVAGGITKIQNAIRYLTIVKHILGEQWLTPAYFRIGTSQLLEDVLKEMKTVKING